MSAEIKTIIVAQRDPHLRELMTLSLEGLGCSILETMPDEHLLGRVRKEVDERRRPMVILDVSRSRENWDGLTKGEKWAGEIVELGRELGTEIPVIITTTASFDDEIERLKKVAIRVVKLPGEMNDFGNSVQAALDKFILG